ncbi:MAG TPA: serine hydrolase domain-containing protein, partial [Herpetosiphonaceae bacterium]|nr:serine hydrolase domain-containing protein [Herpetosiphonaceae bacterium]
MATYSWDELDQHCQRLVRDGATPAIALAVSDRDQTRLVRTYGLANRDTGRPATPATAFELGSVGKSFASIMVLQQCERGALDLGAPIGRYLPWLDLPAAAPITLHHLLSHTAGLPEDAGADQAPRADALTLAAGGPYAPGGEFGYSNAGYNLIGYLLEDLLGQPYGALLRAHILEPLGMAETWPVLDEAARG